MKCVVAMMQHETNTFSPLPTSLGSIWQWCQDWNFPPSGEQAVRIYGRGRFRICWHARCRARRAALDCVVPVTAYAEPSGKVDDDCI